MLLHFKIFTCLQTCNLKFKVYLSTMFFIQYPHFQSCIKWNHLVYFFFCFLLVLHILVSWPTLFEFGYLISRCYLSSLQVLRCMMSNTCMCVIVCSTGGTERSLQQWVVWLFSVTLVQKDIAKGLEAVTLQQILFFIKALAALLCKLQDERFQLMMIVRSTNIDCCLHYWSGVLVKFP